MAEGQRILLLTNDVDCKSNLQYTSQIEKYFLENDYPISETITDADKVVITTCGFHQSQYNKILQVLKKLRSLHFSDQDIVILGCLPKTHEPEIKSNFSGALIPYHESDRLDTVFEVKTPFKEIRLPNVFNYFKESKQEKELFYIKLSSGCVGACSYCVINIAKGRLKSVPKEQIITQYKQAIAQGYKKVYFFGEDTFAYGIDRNEDIFALMDDLIAIDDSMEFFFGQLDLRWLVKYGPRFIALCESGYIKKLDLGIQHINNRILKRMRRGVDFQQAYEVLKAIKERAPELYVSADIIVGFPGETEEEFDQLVDFLVEEKLIDVIKHSGYSDNKLAVSSGFSDKIPTIEIVRRWEILKNALGPKSMYNQQDVDDATEDSASYKKTFNVDMIVCKDISGQ